MICLADNAAARRVDGPAASVGGRKAKRRVEYRFLDSGKRRMASGGVGGGGGSGGGHRRYAYAGDSPIENILRNAHPYANRIRERPRFVYLPKAQFAV